MKNKFYSLLMVLGLLGATQVALAQTKRTCGTMHHMDYLKQQDPALENRLKYAAMVMQKWMDKHPKSVTAKMATTPDTIPVVVHVVYRTSTQNISDAQVHSQIQILNEDFARLNADTVNTPAPFAAVAGGLPYRFVLARRTPDGDPTTGIVRTHTTLTSFIDDDKVKFDAQGGDDAWNTQEYLNIWVCNLGGNLLGYGEFPTGSPTPTMGFVCGYTCFGNTGTAVAPFNKGRTTTHEIGHCFNLYHIWGDDQGCIGSDSVADTPNQAGENFGCPSYPLTDACTTIAPGVMFMDYMDYTDDACMNMFSQGQIARIDAAITNFYPGIVNSIGLQPVVLSALDAGSFKTISPAGTYYCTSTISPKIRIKNWGLTPLTSVTLNYSVDNSNWQTYNWSGSLASLATDTIILQAMTLPAGPHVFVSYTSSPNGSTDMNAANDTSYSNFMLSTIGGLTPLTEGFEGPAFPAPGFTLNNPDGSATWVQSAAGAHTGTSSISIDNFDYSASGQIDELVLPAVDLSWATNATLNFWEAYALYTDPSLPINYSDTLEVLISTDCGLTYSSIYKKFGTALSTIPAVFDTNFFIPQAGDWRQETVNLTPYIGSPLAIVKFRNITDYENVLYLDDINITSVTGFLDNTVGTNVSVYPNPSKGIFNIQLSGFDAEPVTVQVTNQLGEVVYESDLIPNAEQKIAVDLSNRQNGIYMINVATAANEYHKRVLVNK